MNKLSRATLLLVVLLFPMPAAAQQSDEEGDRLHEEALKLYRAGEQQAAIEKFKEAYDANKQAQNLYYLGECYRLLHDLRKSFEYYEKYVETLQGYRRDKFVRRMEELRWGQQGTLTISSKPSEADVILDGEKKGITPKDGEPLVLTVSGGVHSLVLEKAGYFAVSQRVGVEFGEPKLVDIVLKPTSAPPVLSLGASVKGAKVTLDGKLVGQAPIEVEMEAGDHFVVVSKEGYRSFAQKFSANPGDRFKLKAQLVPATKKAPAWSQFAMLRERLGKKEEPPFYKKSTFWLVSGITTGALALGGLGVGVAFNMKANNEYETSPNYTDYKNISIIGYAAGGGCAVLSAVSFLLYMKYRKKPEDKDLMAPLLTIGPTSRGSGAMINGTLAF